MKQCICMGIIMKNKEVDSYDGSGRLETLSSDAAVDARGSSVSDRDSSPSVSAIRVGESFADSDFADKNGDSLRRVDRLFSRADRGDERAGGGQCLLAEEPPVAVCFGVDFFSRRVYRSRHLRRCPRSIEKTNPL